MCLDLSDLSDMLGGRQWLVIVTAALNSAAYMLNSNFAQTVPAGAHHGQV